MKSNIRLMLPGDFPCFKAHTHHSDSTSGGELYGNVRSLDQWDPEAINSWVGPFVWKQPVLCYPFTPQRDRLLENPSASTWCLRDFTHTPASQTDEFAVEVSQQFIFSTYI